MVSTAARTDTWPLEYPLDTSSFADDCEAGEQPGTAEERAEADRAKTLLIEPLLQNFLLHRLASVLGPSEVVTFLSDHLGARRFEGLL